MKKEALTALSVVGMMLLIGMSYPSGATAGVNIGINVPPPPPPYDSSTATHVRNTQNIYLLSPRS
jgi:hypothetical protein